MSRIRRPIAVPQTATITTIARTLGRACDALRFAPPVTHVYNPLSYAWEAHRNYLKRFAAATGRTILLGMNPGPFGMMQTGVPFGEVTFVREFLGIRSGVTPPKHMHPARPIEGFACTRSEVSGARVWGWVQERFGTAERFFDDFFIWNYCPLAFLEESGRNRTPDKLPPAERTALQAVCDDALRDLALTMRPVRVVGIGAFAHGRAIAALKGMHDHPPIGKILHPSPASPAANRGWAAQAEIELRAQGVLLPEG